jgi:hypothetical protein
MSTYDDLLDALRAAPALPEALCKGRHREFDAAPPGTAAEAVAEHAKRAKALCATCPELAPCRAWVDTLTALQRPEGVTAGRKYTPPPTGQGITKRNNRRPGAGTNQKHCTGKDLTA